MLKGPGAARLPVAVLGSGPTTAVFLHQTDGNGLCGWWPYAVWLTSHYKVRAVLLDLCNYNSKAVCPQQTFADDQRAQVAVGMRFAHRAGASRVVLVGASMGGALALASAKENRAAAVVDLSGPPGWGNAEASVTTPTLTVPFLLAASPNDGYVDYPKLQKAFALDPTQSKLFLSPTGGAHGYELLDSASGTGWSPLASQVARWITGDYR
ncbi:MAG: alpha/beta hydrolase [Actinomycetota bacterium]|nr:alpha/beta hydrolase [Actinomycetota bacterium]